MYSMHVPLTSMTNIQVKGHVVQKLSSGHSETDGQTDRQTD